jgi:Uma2 family endonuclease
MTKQNQPADLARVIAQRRALGIDRYDEVWQGEYRIVAAPAWDQAEVDDEIKDALRPYARAAGLFRGTTFNIGERNDFRVPDGGYLRTRPSREHRVFVPTAAIVIEILSPRDDTFAKFPFYAARGVEEIVVADPDARRVTFYVLDRDRYTEVKRSPLLDVSADEITAAVDWPPEPA